MLNNGFAVLIVVLCILPNTAPFSSIAAVRSSIAYSGGAGIHEDTRVPPLADSDSNDAIAFERATFLSESRICSSGPAPGADGTTTFVPVDRWLIGAHVRAIDPLACPYVLRV
ncbi:MAG TPA: hypothetical protein VFP91_17925 [Vicinamibacterales bacterium]|nr:hypothetical protein [Vicinamibacterales bacterium]